MQAENPWYSREITVTARKRAEGLQSTPIAISAYSGEMLEALGVTQLDQIADFTPNLRLDNNPSFGGAGSAAAIYIRGVGQKEFLPTTEAGVGLYVDGVYVARSVGAILDLVDIERIEVLRGPQGTLFGRNTIGGAINIITEKPSTELAGIVAFRLGSDEEHVLRGSINLPLSSSVAARLSIASLDRDGYVSRTTDGLDLGDTNKLVARAGLRWRPSDSITIDWSVDGTRTRENGSAIELLGIDYRSSLFNPNGLPLLPPGSAPVAGAYVTNPPFDAPTDNFALLNNYLAYFLGGQPCLSSFGAAYSPQGSAPAASIRRAMPLSCRERMNCCPAGRSRRECAIPTTARAFCHSKSSSPTELRTLLWRPVRRSCPQFGSQIPSARSRRWVVS